MNVGLFGGTFNPIHCGHLRSADEICSAFALDRIYFIPSASPPHKQHDDIAPVPHRYKMVELAVADNPAFVASRIEIERSGPSYSVDTIRTFGAGLKSTSIAFIIGMDAFCEMHTWREYREIPRLCDLIVTSRPGFPTPAIEDLLPVALRSAFWYDSSKHRYQHDSGHTLTLYTINGLQISASAVRENIQLGHSLHRQIPPAVSAYITEHDLYTKREDIC